MPCDVGDRRSGPRQMERAWEVPHKPLRPAPPARCRLCRRGQSSSFPLLDGSCQTPSPPPVYVRFPCVLLARLSQTIDSGATLRAAQRPREDWKRKQHPKPNKQTRGGAGLPWGPCRSLLPICLVAQLLTPAPSPKTDQGKDQVSREDHTSTPSTALREHTARVAVSLQPVSTR